MGESHEIHDSNNIEIEILKQAVVKYFKFQDKRHLVIGQELTNLRFTIIIYIRNSTVLCLERDSHDFITFVP